jgi:hypothetical protein
MSRSRVSALHRVCAALLFMYFATPSIAAPVWSDSCQSLEQWDILDLNGDGSATELTDHSVPPPFGPSTIAVDGTHMLGMARGLVAGDGYYTVLYRENEPRDRDADGVTLFRADYGENIGAAHNTKEERAHLWLEQDNDGGFQIRVTSSGANDTIMAIEAGIGLVTAPWNRTNWIWQKVHIEGNLLRAKYWPAQSAEPEEWPLEVRHPALVGEFARGRAGFKAVSGNINVAYVSFNTSDISIEPPRTWLTYPNNRAAQVDDLHFTLFANLDAPVSGPATVAVYQKGAVIASTRFDLTLNAGQSEMPVVVGTAPIPMAVIDATSATSATGATGGVVVKLSGEPPAGLLRVVIHDDAGTFHAERTLPYHPAKALLRRIDVVDRALGALGELQEKQPTSSESLLHAYTIRDAAARHRNNARISLAAGKEDKAARSTLFAEYAIAELAGWKGDALRQEAPGIELVEVVPDSNALDDSRDDPDQITNIYSTEYRISFGSPTFDAQSFVMGRRYKLDIPWSVEGTVPDRDYRVELTLYDPLRQRGIVLTDTTPDIPTSQWTPGQTYTTTFDLDVPPESQGVPERDRSPDPPVRDAEHILLVRMYDPNTGPDDRDGASLLLGNQPRPDGRPERSFVAGDVYTSAWPLEIRGLEPGSSRVNEVRTDSLTVRNTGGADESLGVVVTARTETRRVLQQWVEPSILSGKAARVYRFEWTPNTAGRIEFAVDIVRDGHVLTTARRHFMVAPPVGFEPSLRRGNTMCPEGGVDALVTPVTISAGRSARISTEVFSVAPDGSHLKLVGDGIGTDTSLTVLCEPWIGRYDIRADFRDFKWDRRILATSVITDSTDVIVNGEPFIVKGVNVHGLDGGGTERGRLKLDILKRLGFNSVRGDYPSRMMVDLAHDANMFWSVLAPFSCGSTTDNFAQNQGPPLVVEREITRLFIERYVDSPGVLMWNSANEMGQSLTDLLVSIYSVYKSWDPERRPVHYANLYGQNRWQGQDMMAVNYYFSYESAVDRQPIIEQSIELGAKHGLPVIYTEFNGYSGPVPTDGREAMRDQFDWGVETGMSGGFLYMFPNSRSHPGVIDRNFVTNKVFDGALMDAFADAKVSLSRTVAGTPQSPAGMVLRVANRRRFTLRAPVMHMEIDGIPQDPIQLENFAALDAMEVRVELPAQAPGPSHVVIGRLEFVTHHGMESSVPFRLIAE